MSPGLERTMINDNAKWNVIKEPPKLTEIIDMGNTWETKHTHHDHIKEALALYHN